MLLAGAPCQSCCWPERCGEGAERPGALWQRSIGKKLLAGRREVCCWPGRYGGASAERRRYGGAFAGRGAAKCGKEGGALRWGPCAWGTQRWGRWAGAEALKPPVGDPAWEPVLGNLRGGPCAGKQGRTGRRWSLPQPVARILLCGALPEFKVKNLLLQCTYNGAGRDFFSHFNRNPA